MYSVVPLWMNSQVVSSLCHKQASMSIYPDQRVSKENATRAECIFWVPAI